MTRDKQRMRGAHAFEACTDGSLIIYATLPDRRRRVDPRRTSPRQRGPGRVRRRAREEAEHAVTGSSAMQTASYFDSRPDARFFMADVDGVVVSIRENLPTYGVTDGEVWAACRIHERLIERRFASVDHARRELARCVREWIGARADTPTIGVWVSLRRGESTPRLVPSAGCRHGNRASTKKALTCSRGAAWCA